MACKRCNGEKWLHYGQNQYSGKTDGKYGINVDVNNINGELWITSVADTYEPNYQELTIKINYCPICGKRLREELYDPD